jgi:hypothetical protein
MQAPLLYPVPITFNQIAANAPVDYFIFKKSRQRAFSTVPTASAVCRRWFQRNPEGVGCDSNLFVNETTFRGEISC